MNGIRTVGRANGNYLNHNLWNNNGTWWIHYTLYPTPVTKERVRQSLHCKTVEEARIRRDAILGKRGDYSKASTVDVLPLAA